MSSKADWIEELRRENERLKAELGHAKKQITILEEKIIKNRLRMEAIQGLAK